MAFTLNSKFQVKLIKMIESEIELLREQSLVQVNLTQDQLRLMQGEHRAYLKVLDVLMPEAEREVLEEQ